MGVKTILTCDKQNCGHKLEFDDYINDAIIKQLTDNGWKNIKIDGEWKIICNQHK